jgi:serine/threonine protein kinase
VVHHGLAHEASSAKALADADLKGVDLMPSSKNTSRNTVYATSFEVYQVIGQVGEGATGTVFKVIDSDGKNWALKQLDQSKATRQRLKRFRNELEFCRRGIHPGIVKVIDHGLASDGSTFYVMPLYPRTLRNVIEARIRPDNVLSLFHQMLDAAEAAHLKNVVHRDLKPENILIQDESPEVAMADFGIAHFGADDLATLVETSPRERLGSFQYAAPEQRQRGGVVDHRADIFSLGSMLNEMFTGAPVHGPGHPTISSVEAAAQFAYLDQVIAAMVRQNPADRPRSIEDVKEQMRRAGDLAASAQKISALEDRVIPASDLEDPLIADPIKIIGYDFNNGTLSVILSRHVTPQWLESFRNMGNWSSILGHEPETFRFVQDRASTQVEARSAAQVFDFFKGWISNANQKYRQDAERRHREALAAKEVQRSAEVQRERERQQVLARLKL